LYIFDLFAMWLFRRLNFMVTGVAQKLLLYSARRFSRWAN